MEMVWLVVKPVLIFFFGYTLIRIMGKHHIGNMTPLDFLVAVVLGNILVQPIVADKIGLTFVYGGLFVATYAIVARLILVNPRRKLLTFKPAMLVANGVIDMEAMKRERITVPHLLAELRVAGYS
ncbi:MAG: YetF domain-containing protein, partial [Patescibacteria group bacterium]